LYFSLIIYVHTFFFFFFNDPATTEIYTLSLHDALPIFISGHAEVYLEISKDPQARDHLLAIIKASDRAASLTRQLLAFSRKQFISTQVVDVGRLLTELSKMLRRLIAENIELTVNVVPDLGRIKADPSQIEQVIMNLAINARDAMPDGGKLTIESSNATMGERDPAWRMDL